MQFFEISQVASIDFATQFLQNWGSLFDLVSLLTQLATTNATNTTVLKETGVKVQHILTIFNKGSTPFHFTAYEEVHIVQATEVQFHGANARVAPADRTDRTPPSWQKRTGPLARS